MAPILKESNPIITFPRTGKSAKKNVRNIKYAKAKNCKTCFLVRPNRTLLSGQSRTLQFGRYTEEQLKILNQKLEHLYPKK